MGPVALALRDSARQMSSMVGAADLGDDSWNRGRRMGEMQVIWDPCLTGLKLL